MAAWRNRLFDMGFATIGATHADQWLKPIARGDGIILMFHRVRPREPKDFAPNRFLEITP